MPNYLYKCTECNAAEKMELPISTDPILAYTCLIPLCNGEMTRRISRPGSFSLWKDTVGRFYKNATGKEFGSA